MRRQRLVRYSQPRPVVRGICSPRERERQLLQQVQEVANMPPKCYAHDGRSGDEGQMGRAGGSDGMHGNRESPASDEGIRLRARAAPAEEPLGARLAADRARIQVRTGVGQGREGIGNTWQTGIYSIRRRLWCGCDQHVILSAICHLAASSHAFKGTCCV